MCEQETFVGREPIEDDDGDPTGVYEVRASCGGAMAVECDWQFVLFASTFVSVDDWWITSTVMAELDAAHQAGREPDVPTR